MKTANMKLEIFPAIGNNSAISDRPPASQKYELQIISCTTIFNPLPYNLKRMAPSRTSTVKSKHAANKSGIRNSKNSSRPQSDGVSKQRKPPKSKAPPLKSVLGPAQRKKQKVYTAKELGIPTLNMVTPVGVEKPRGKKKGKVFVDDRVGASSFSTCIFMINGPMTDSKFSGIDDDDSSNGECGQGRADRV
jgi:hypothetical protein